MTDKAPVRSRTNTRARLLEAAAEVFAERGFGEASVEVICDRAGFTRGAFYSNFGSKESMFLELAQEVGRQRIAMVRDRVREFLDQHPTDRPGEPFGIADIISVLEDGNDDRLSVMLAQEIGTQALRDPSLAEQYAACEREIIDEVVRIIDEIVHSRRVALRVAPALAARTLINACTTRPLVAL